MSKILLAVYATGVLLAYFNLPCSITGLFFATGTLFLFWVFLRNLPVAWIPLLGMVCLAGFVLAHQQLHGPDNGNWISRFAGETAVAVEGVIINVEKRAAGGYRVLIDTQQVETMARDLCAVEGKLLLYVKEGELVARPGQVVRWFSKLRKPSRFGNPGEFNYPLYLASQKIYVTAFVKHARDIAIIQNHPAGRSSNLENLRLNLGKEIDNVLPEPEAALLKSLLLGYRSGITPEQRQTLSDSGIAHLFAISGLHFGLLALIFYRAGLSIYTRSERLMLWNPPQKVLPLLLILPLAIYLLLTGNAWATRRAFLMMTLFALLITSNRKTSPFNLLALVALLLLIVSPAALFQPGFQLSFAGVAGILCCMPAVQNKITGLPTLLRWVLLLLSTTFFATLATAPVLLWHFHQFSHSGLLTNLVAIPLIAWGAVPSGLFALATLLFSTALADCLIFFAGFLVSLTMNFADFINHLPFMKMIPRYLTLTDLVILCSVLLISLPTNRQKRSWRTRALVLLFCVIVAVISTSRKEPFQVTAFSVGQGDATLISFFDRHYLVDGGGLPGSFIDPGEDLIAPAMGRMGVGQLEGIVATHSHPDHSAGLVYILQRFPVKTFYYAGDIDLFPIELRKAIQQSDAEVVHLAAGWADIYSGAEQEIRLFVPDQKANDINERSIITYARQSATGVLLTADSGKETLQQLLASGFAEPVSILKLPHHGSRYASPETFLQHFKPAISFVSAGLGNSYGFPHEETLTACEKHQTRLYRTDRQGMLTFNCSKSRWLASVNKPGS